MKRLSYLSLASLCMFFLLVTGIESCQNIDMNEDLLAGVQQDSTTQVGDLNFNISLKTAKYIASASTPVASNQITEVEAYVSPVDPRDTALYIVNFKEGWMVISGDKRVQPILVSSTKGKLTSQNLDNPGVAIWISNLADGIAELKRSKDTIGMNRDIVDNWNLIDKSANLSKENSDIFDTKYDKQTNTNITRSNSSNYNYYLVRKLVSTTVSPIKIIEQKGPLLKTKWGQGAPWNTVVPQDYNGGYPVASLTGCAAVAIAQVLYNLHSRLGHVNGLYHTVKYTGYANMGSFFRPAFYRGDYFANSQRWEQMPLKREDNFTPNANYVADLMADLGARLGMKYSKKESSALVSNNIDVFHQCGISCLQDGYNGGTVISELRNNTPVFITSFTDYHQTGHLFWKQDHYGGGHAWVVDGFKIKSQIYTYNYVWEVTGTPPSSNYHEYNSYDPYYGGSIPIEDAIKAGIRPYSQETKNYTFNYTTLMMNWGWDGSWDYADYNSNPGWGASGYTFQYNTQIIWQFR